MEKHLVVIGSLVVIGIVTVIFGKVIGPKLLNWTLPSFNKATNKLDDALVGKPGEWEAKVRRLVEMSPERLKQRVADIFSQFAKPLPAGVKLSTSEMPLSVKTFFVRYSQLSFDGQTHVLDDAVLRIVVDKQRRYLLMGRSEDDGHFYAMDLQDKKSVVLLEVTSNGKVLNVEEDSPSFEHFVTLQHELYLQNV